MGGGSAIGGDVRGGGGRGGCSKGQTIGGEGCKREKDEGGRKRP